MKKFFLINILFLLVGQGMAQQAIIGGSFSDSHCVSSASHPRYTILNNSTSPGTINTIRWVIRNPDGSIKEDQTTGNQSSYMTNFSQAGTYWAAIWVTWGATTRADSMKITVHPMPQFSFVKSTDSICPGECVTFTYTMTSPFTKGMVKSLSWDFGDGGASTLPNPARCYPNATNVAMPYTVSLLLTDTNGCQARVDSTNYVFVRTKPEVKFAADNVYFCFGNDVQNPTGTPVFTNYTDTGKTGVSNTYRWNFGDGSSSTSVHTSHAYTQGTYSVTLVAKNQYGCTDSLVRSNYITVNQLIPKYTVSDTIICKIPHTITLTGQDNTVTYTWRVDDVTHGVQTGRNATMEFRDARDTGTRKLYVTILDQRSGAGGACTVTDSSTTLHIYNTVKPLVSITDTNECDPTHLITFKNVTQYPWSDNFGKAATYWDFWDGNTGSGATTTHTYGTSAVPKGGIPDGGYGHYMVQMSGVTPYGCPLNTVIQYVHIFRMYAKGEMVDPAPPDPPHGCVPHTVTIKNNLDSLITSSPIVSYVWKWDFRGDQTDTTGGNLVQAVHKYEDTGSYHVYLTLTNEQGCVHDIFVQNILVGDTAICNFTFLNDTNCKAAINIRVFAYDSVDALGNLVGKVKANAWSWEDDNGSSIGGTSDTTTISPNEVGDACVNLVASHNGCVTGIKIKKCGMGYICPPIAVIDEPKDDPPGQPPLYCGFEYIPFKHKSKGALYLRWYAGDSFPATDTAKQSKSPLMVYDYATQTYSHDSTAWFTDSVIGSKTWKIYHEGMKNPTGGDGNWGFTYGPDDYLYKLKGDITLYLWAMNDSSATDDVNDIYYNFCGYCEHMADQHVLISDAKMNFTVSQESICQQDSVVFFDSTICTVGIFGWGFYFDTAWNMNADYLEGFMKDQAGNPNLGEMMVLTDYEPDPTYSKGEKLTFTRPNKYRVVLIDTCGFGCIRMDTLLFSVYPKSIPFMTSSADGITYRRGKKDTICINSGGKYYLKDSSWSAKPYDTAKVVSWKWEVASATDTVKNPVLVIKDAGLHDLKLTVKNEYGCDSTRIFDYQVLANNILPGFTLSNNKKDWCNKTEIAFTNTTVVQPVGNNTNTLLKLVYYWGDGDSSVVYAKSREQAVTGHSYNLPSATNKVYVRLKASIVDPTTQQPIGCEEEFMDSLTISRPIANFTDDGHEFPCPEIAGGVKGRTITFTSLSTGKLEQLIWHFGDSASGSRNIAAGSAHDSSVISPIHTYNNAGVYDVLLIAQDSNRCVDSILKTDYIKILGPRGDVIYTEGSDCKPLVVNFQGVFDEHEPSYLPDSLLIFTGDGSTMTNSGGYLNLTRSRRYVYQNAGIYNPTYYLYKTVTFGGNKETCVVQVNEDDPIYVIELTPDFETLPLYCPELPVAFKNTSSWVPDVLSYDSLAWSFGNGDTSQIYDGQTVYDSAGTYLVKLTMKVKRCVRADSVNIEVMEFPNIYTSPDTAMACDGLEVEFRVDSLTDLERSRILSYEWEFEDGTTMSGNPASREFLTSGEYPYELKLTFTPSECYKIHQDTVTVFAYKSPQAAFEANPEVGAVDEIFTFTDKSIRGDGIINKWFWDFGDGSTSPDSLHSTQEHSYTSTSGTILVTLRIEDEYGCKATTDLQIIVTEKLSFPNVFTPGGNCPPKNKCEFRPMEDKGYFKEFKLEVYDRWGMLVWSRHCTDPNCPDYQSDNFWWDGTNKQGKPVTAGVYYWVVYATPLSETAPFIKNGSVTVVK